MLVDNMIAKAREEATETIHQIHEEAEQEAERLAEKTLLTAIQRISFEQATENTLSVVHIQSDELKGRIIGREGRNIKAFENATGWTSLWTIPPKWSFSPVLIPFAGSLPS